MRDINVPIIDEPVIEEHSSNWRVRAIANHQRELDNRHVGGRFQNNPRLYGHTRQNRMGGHVMQNQLSNLRELRANMQNFDSMLDEIDQFQQQTESLVANLQAMDRAMGNRELEPVDEEDDNKPKGLSESDLAMQRIYNYDAKQHVLKDQTCSICLIDIEESKEAETKTMVCELTCGHSFHAPCVLGWLTKQSHCCPNCRKDLRTTDVN